jgi:cysteine synthase A
MEVVAVEPAENAVLSTGEPGSDDFQGMGAGFVSDILDTDLIDAVETVELAAAERESRRLAREEGILVGQSSAASGLAARRVATRLADPDAECPPAPRVASADGDEAVRDGSETSGAAGNDRAATATDRPSRDPADAAYDDCPLVVTVFWDSGERYFSTGMFDDVE